jgi:AmiR/NasT family two-component response regulator
VTSALVIASNAADAPPLAADLQAVGIHVLGAVTCDMLVREVVRLAPDVVVGFDPEPGGALFDAATLLAAARPAPLLVFTMDASVEAMRRALDAGIVGWVVQGYAAARLRPLVQLAQARFERDRAQREAYDDLARRFEERKLVDRAKGILMRTRGLAEDEAFGRLRSASMQGKQRIGQLAQQLVRAAEDAENVNRAGQLRMLAQRIVKLYALEAQGSDPRDARLLLGQSVERVRASLERLSRALSKPTFGDLLQSVLRAWAALEPLLPQGSSERVDMVDAAAERLLEAADRLTAALEAGSPVVTLTVVNTCGRQRMLSQRLAKQALLGQSTGETAAAFEQALARLETLPLSTPDTRVELGRARREWLTLVEAARRLDEADACRRLAAASEELLALFERLTERYERELQLLLA